MKNNLKKTVLSVSGAISISLAKKMALVVVILLTFVNAVYYFDSDSCQRLLSNGYLIQEKYWQPDGCMLHVYKNSEIIACLKQRKIAFIGDSRMRELFYSFVASITNSFNTEKKAHSSLSFENEDVSLSFYWMPEINGSSINLYQYWLKNNIKPDIILQAAAAHTIKRTNGSKNSINEFQKNLTSHFPLMKQMVDYGIQIYWLLQEPVVERRLSISRIAITNEQLQEYNQVALTTFQQSSGKAKYNGIFILEAIAEVGRITASTFYDGLHAGDQTKQINIQILSNLFCNDNLKPEFGICCQQSPKISITQKMAFFFGLLCIILAVLANIFIRNKTDEYIETGKASEPNHFTKIKEILNALAKMSFILVYFFICDRTNIFMRSNKHYSHLQFFIPLLYIVCLGLFGIEQAKSPVLLNRDQTNEWKGWMQLVILIYHFSGASSNIGIYMHIRLLVAMYLFMTGYGHFSYFWTRGDFSFHRVINVLFRLNYLTIMLCIVMNRPYQFYYFVPLCTFWFLILYLTMMIWPRVVAHKSNPNDDKTILEWKVRYGYYINAMKLFALLCIIILLFYSQKVFENIFSWWPFIKLFEFPSSSLNEWWFRCRLDRFALFHGATFCFLYIMLQKLRLLDDSKQGCLISTKYSLITIPLSILLILAYTSWALNCTSKVECNYIHSYASFIPITSFVLIRNIPGYLRSCYSSFFAWFGKISLELFISQYHIWLAADTKGVLVLVSPSWPTLNVVVTTFIFVCIAHEINQITAKLANYIVGSANNGNTAICFRFLIVLLVLMAITTPEYIISILNNVM